ncbi:MAG: NAD-binding protein [Streptosporangiales bacterium]|nr:NAD-binding protein [Streptosporangiales bacterium]
MRSTLGFVGVGNMGLPMIHRLIEAGHELIVADVSAEARARAEAEGATVAASPAEVADRTEIVLTSLPSPAVVREVTLGEAGLAKAERLTTWIELSTTGGGTVRAISDALSSRGISTVDSPVSGGIRGAWDGTLAVMAAADPTVFESVKPILDVLGNVFHVGTEPGLGQAMKVANNYLSATAMAATSEAVVFGLKAGLDAQVMIDVFNSGTGRNSATADKFPRSVLTRKFAHGFTTGLMYKDLELLSEQANQLRLPMWVAESVRQLWMYALARGGEDSDFTSLITHLEEWAGVEARGRDEDSPPAT